MFLRKYWLPISVFIVAIVGIGLYLLATQPPPEPVKIYKVVEPEKPTKQPKAEVPVGDTSQDGHRHADGTWHEGPHQKEDGTSHEETREKPEQPTLQAPQLQEYAQYIPEHLLEAQRLVAVDPERARAAFRDALPEDPLSAEFEVAVKDIVQTLVDLNPGIYDLPTGHPRRVEYSINRNLLTAVSVATKSLRRLSRDTGNPVYRDRIEEIHSWEEPYRALVTSTTQLEEEKNQ